MMAQQSKQSKYHEVIEEVKATGFDVDLYSHTKNWHRDNT